MAKNRPDLSFNDLCNLVSLEVGENRSSPESAKRYLIALYKVILNQLKVNKRIYLYGFGFFELYERRSGERLIPDITDEKLEKKLVYVKPRNVVKFRPSQVLDTNVNENDFKLKYSMKEKRKTQKEKTLGDNVADLLNKAERRSKNKWQNN